MKIDIIQVNFEARPLYFADYNSQNFELTIRLVMLEDYTRLSKTGIFLIILIKSIYWI